MINPLRKQSNSLPTRHIIVEEREWPIDEEYALAGMKDGWLINHRMVKRRTEIVLYYLLNY